MAIVWRPRPAAAVSASRTARMAYPQPLRLISRKTATPPAVTTAMTAASVRASSATPATETGGMPMIPLEPPVSPRHSVAPCSITNANASVIMAR